MRLCLESLQGALFFFQCVPNLQSSSWTKTEGCRQYSRRFPKVRVGESACCSKILPLHARGLIHHPQPTLLQPVRTIIRRQVNVKWKSIERQWWVTSTSSSTHICSILYVKPQICWTGRECLRPKYHFRCLLHDTCPSSFSASPNSSILCRC